MRRQCWVFLCCMPPALSVGAFLAQGHLLSFLVLISLSSAIWAFWHASIMPPWCLHGHLCSVSRGVSTLSPSPNPQPFISISVPTVASRPVFISTCQTRIRSSAWGHIGVSHEWSLISHPSSFSSDVPASVTVPNSLATGLKARQQSCLSHFVTRQEQLFLPTAA